MAEVLVAIAILVVAAFSVATIIERGAKEKAVAEKRAATVALSANIIEHLRYFEACSAVLGPGSSSTQVVNETQLQQDGSVASNGWQMELEIPEIHSGTSMTGTLLSASAPNDLIPERRLKIDSLRLADGKPLNPNGSNPRYHATVYLKTSEIGGVSFKEQPIGGTTIELDNVTKKVAACGVANASVFTAACVAMGCSYNAALTPPCRCLRSQVVCSAPGAVPVAITADGFPTCMQVGGEGTCAAGEYLVGVGIGYKECAAIPSSGPTPTPSATASPTASATPTGYPSGYRLGIYVNSTCSNMQTYSGAPPWGVPFNDSSACASGTAFLQRHCADNSQNYATCPFSPWSPGPPPGYPCDSVCQ